MTVGHGGKECVHEQYWNKREIELIGDFFYLFHGKGASVAVYHCPACGIELKPDPLPLPVPEGCKKVTSEEFSNVAFEKLRWRVGALDNLFFRYWLIGPDRESTESAWRKAFGK